MQKLARWFSCAAIGVVLLFSVRPASAQQPDTERAQQHETRAEAARNALQWNVAAAEYQRAYRYDPNPKYLFNIGLAFDLAGKRTKALSAFRAYLAKQPTGKYAVTAKAKADELSAILGSLQLRKHLSAAERYRREDKHDAAAFEYMKAYTLTKNTDYLFEVGESYRALGANAQAVAAYRDYLQADGSGKFTLTAQARIRKLETLERPAAAPESPAAVPEPPAAAPEPPTAVPEPPTATAPGLVAEHKPEVPGDKGTARPVGFGMFYWGLGSGRNTNIRGLSVNLFAGYNRSVRGFEFGGANIVRREVVGLQLGYAFNIAGSVHGAQLGWMFNIAGRVRGVQLAPLLNVARRVRGLQIGMVNVTTHLTGVQIGLLNIATKNWLPLMVGLNAGF